MKHTILLVILFTTVVHAIQPGALPAQSASLRPLKFGDVNFLHTTDTHGWHAGHLLEPSYSADWGDYISFASQLRSRLASEGKDLLVIDTGDRIEGNGLYDASDPRGKYTFPIFTKQHFDLICSGNHELYQNTSAIDDSEELVPAYSHNYLSSNLDIFDPQTKTFHPLGHKYRTFTTQHQKLHVLAFGFLFDFNRNAANTRVTPVAESLKQTWFRDALTTSNIDLIIVIGHVGLRSYEFDQIHAAIRTVHPDLPIHFFGGHFHIRDYRIFDERSAALASGRYMETIGFASMSDIKSGHPSYERRYIDNNLFSLYQHSNKTMDTFHTNEGLRASRAIAAARRSLHLDNTYGCASNNYWTNRAPYPHNNSIFSLLVDEISPSIVNQQRQNRTRMMIHNTGAVRFDIFKGPFTVDSTFIVSPFTSKVQYIPDVPFALAKRLLPILNGEDDIADLAIQDHEFANLNFDNLITPETRAYRASKPFDHYDNDDNHDQQQQQQQPILLQTTTSPLTPGYTTHDDLGRSGDDTLHSPIAFYTVPNCVQYLSHNASTANTTDLIFNAFLQPYILGVLNFLSTPVGGKGYSAADVDDYMPGETFTTLLAKWVSENWAQNC